MQIVFLVFLFFKCLISLRVTFRHKSKQGPLYDDQYRQAEVPPFISTVFEIPNYSKNDLYKWHDYIKANKELVAKNNRKNNDLYSKVYLDTLDTIGKLQAGSYRNIIK